MPQEFVLETDRLLLRHWRVSDASVQRELWTERDPRVPPHRQIGADGRPTIDDLADRIRNPDRSEPDRLLVVVRKGSGDVIGYCGLIDSTHGPSQEPELAYELLRAVWGRGYATEASWAVVGWAQESGYRRLWAGVRDWNTASRRVLAKLGFVEDHVEPDSTYGDSLITTKLL